MKIKSLKLRAIKEMKNNNKNKIFFQIFVKSDRCDKDIHKDLERWLF